MKIAVAAVRYPPAVGGAEVYIERVAAGLARLDHHVRALTTEYEQHRLFKLLPEDVPRREWRDGVMVHRDRSIPWRRYGVFFTPATAARIALNPPDLVYGYGFGRWPATAGCIMARMTGAKFIIQPIFAPPGSSFDKAYHRWMGPILRKADGAVFYSEYERELMKSRGPIPARSIVAPPGIDPKFFKKAESDELFNRFGMADRPVVLSVGRLEEGKRLDVLIRAMSMVKEASPEAGCIIVGPDFGELGRLKALAAECGVSDRMAFAGKVDDIAPFYHGASVLAHPSGFELFGIVMAEANAAGLPVVAARAGSAPEVVEDGRTGLLVPPSDHEAMAEAIIGVLTDDELRRRLIKEGRNRARKKYDWGATVASIERFCGEVVG